MWVSCLLLDVVGTEAAGTRYDAIDAVAHSIVWNSQCWRSNGSVGEEGSLEHDDDNDDVVDLLVGAAAKACNLVAGTVTDWCQGPECRREWGGRSGGYPRHAERAGAAEGAENLDWGSSKQDRWLSKYCSRHLEQTDSVWKILQQME